MSAEELLRRDMIERELKAYIDAGSEATYPVYFRGAREYLPVIKVSPRDLVLNPKNNRVHGQLADHPDRQEVLSNPSSSKSQQILHRLLADTAEFEKLKEQLSELGQREPGLITRDGLLVNGNTRAAALIDLGLSHIEVGVLPANATEIDVLNIEMELQVTDLVHQDYSFTNELLLMRRFLESGATPKDLANKMNWFRRGIQKVEANMRLLDIIEEVRSLAPEKIKYSEFDSKSQHLKDLDNDYQRLKNEGDIVGAEALKWTRLSALFLGLNKDQVRAIDSDFVSNELLSRLDNTKDDYSEVITHIHKYSVTQGTGVSDPLFEDEDQDPNMIDMRSFLSDYLNRESDEAGEQLESTYSRVAYAARRTAERLIDEQKLETARAEPVETLIDARERLVTLRSNLSDALADQKFSPEKFVFQLEKVKEELLKIEQIVSNKTEG